MAYWVTAALKIVAVLAFSGSLFGDGPSIPSQSDGGKMPIEFGALPLRFESNRGQTDREVQFLCRARDYTVFLTATGALLSLNDSSIRMKLIGSESRPKVSGLDRLPGTTNYFLGTDPKRWLTNVPGYARVAYRGVYPGVDLIYYGNERQLEYDFVIAPGVDPGVIRVSFDGVTAIHLNALGDLVLSTTSGTVLQRAPFVWQDEGGLKKRIAARYALKGAREVGFEIEDYNRTATLVVDPVLVYATYLGGADRDMIRSAAVGSDGDLYVTGTTSSRFPVTPGAIQPGGGGQTDVFVARFNATGTALIYATYFGSNGAEWPSGIAVDAHGNAYVTGVTGMGGSTNFPVTAGAYQTAIGGGEDAFVTKLDPSGSSLVYSTFLGGNGWERPGGERAGGIAVDSDGNAYITGEKSCLSDFPLTPDAFQSGSCHSFVTKLNASGTAIVYSTDFGGQHIAVGQDGSVYLAGFVGDIFTSRASNFPTTEDAFRRNCRLGEYLSHGDSFVAKLDSAGGGLLYSTCFPGYITAIAADMDGNVVVTGVTNSPDFVTTEGSFRSTGNTDCDADGYGSGLGEARGGECEVFVAKLNASGTALVYSTYIARVSPGFTAPTLALDAAGNAHIAGFIPWRDFPTTPGAFAVNGPGFLTKLNALGSALVESTLLPQGSLSLAVDADGNAYVVAWTPRDNLGVTPGAVQGTYGGGDGDGVIMKIHLRTEADTSSTIPRL